MNRRQFLLSLALLPLTGAALAAPPREDAYWLPAVEEARRRLAKHPGHGFVLEFFAHGGHSYAVHRLSDGRGWCLWECQGEALAIRHTVHQRAK